MSTEDRKSCSASLNDRFLVFALIYPGFLTISCKGFVCFGLSGEEEGELRQHLAEEEGRGGGEVSTAFCTSLHYQREVKPTEGTIIRAILTRRLSDPSLGGRLGLTKTEGSVYICDGLRLMCGSHLLLF